MAATPPRLPAHAISRRDPGRAAHARPATAASAASRAKKKPKKNKQARVSKVIMDVPHALAATYLGNQASAKREMEARYRVTTFWSQTNVNGTDRVEIKGSQVENIKLAMRDMVRNYSAVMVSKDLAQSSDGSSDSDEASSAGSSTNASALNSSRAQALLRVREKPPAATFYIKTSKFSAVLGPGASTHQGLEADFSCGIGLFKIETAEDSGKTKVYIESRMKEANAVRKARKLVTACKARIVEIAGGEVALSAGAAAAEDAPDDGGLRSGDKAFMRRLIARHSSLQNLPLLDENGEIDEDAAARHLPEIQQAAKEDTEECLTMRRNLTRKVKKLVAAAQALDVCFLIDSTGSMCSWMDSAKNTIGALQAKILKDYPKSRPRFAFVGYKDFDESSEALRYTVHDFSEDTAAFAAAVKATTASGGGDTAEDVYGGLLRATRQLSWSSSSKLLIFIADAPAHGLFFHDASVLDDLPGDDPDGALMCKLLTDLARREIVMTFIRINAITDTMIGKFAQLEPSLEIRTASLTDAAHLLDTVFLESEKVITASVNASLSAGETYEPDDGPLIRVYAAAPKPRWADLPPIQAETRSFLSPVSAALNDLVDMRTSLPVKSRFKIAPHAFAKGSVRYAFHAVEIDASGATTPVVLKCHRRSKMRSETEPVIMQAKMDTIAAFLAEQYNTFTGGSLRFNTARLAVMEDESVYAIEPFLEGNFVRYSDNVGRLSDDFVYDPVVHAFSHFTYQFTSSTLIVVDLQGVGQILTDPALHSYDPRPLHTTTNLGEDGINHYFATHVCNEVCQALRLQRHPRQPKAAADAHASSASMHARAVMDTSLMRPVPNNNESDTQPARPVRVSASAKPSPSPSPSRQSQAPASSESRAELFVKGWQAHDSVTEEQLRAVFAPHGQITSIRIPVDTKTGQPKMFGFVTFASTAAAESAMAALHMQSVPILGVLQVVPSHASPPKPTGKHGGVAGRDHRDDRRPRSGHRLHAPARAHQVASSGASAPVASPASPAAPAAPASSPARSPPTTAAVFATAEMAFGGAPNDARVHSFAAGDRLLLVSSVETYPGWYSAAVGDGTKLVPSVCIELQLDVA